MCRYGREGVRESALLCLGLYGIQLAVTGYRCDGDEDAFPDFGSFASGQLPRVVVCR
jgi:hypothetical protein